MSEKNFASYGDMETLVTEIASKCGPYTEITYEDWLQLTPYQQEHGRWDVTGVPGADGTVSIDLMTKLWENPSPSVAFAPQDITLSSNNYDLLLIIYVWTISSAQELSIMVKKGKGIVLSAGLPSANGSRNMARYCSFTSGTVINFGEGRDCVGTSSSTLNNDRCVPVVIYGIKLHHTVPIKAIAESVSTLAENCVFDPTDTDLESTNVEDAIKELESNFQDGVDAVYDAVVAKGSTPASHSLSDIIAAIAAIPTGITPSGTKSITANGTHDVTQYASASVAVQNSNSATYTYPSGSTGGKVDLGATNSYRYVNAANVYAKGKTDGASTYTWKIVFSLPRSGSLVAYRNGSNVFSGGISDGEGVQISGATIKWA